MKNNGRQKSKGDGQSSRRVRVEFVDSAATKVAIAGTFNDWRPDVSRMIAIGDGKWFKELALPPGTYEYLIVADGKWVPDPAAKATVPNSFGGVNSIMAVSGTTKTR